MIAQWIAPISDRFSSLCARVFSPAAAILESEKTLGTRLPFCSDALVSPPRDFFDGTFYVAYTNTFLRVANAGEWRCSRCDLGVVRGDNTSGRTSKARNEAVAIAG